MDALMSERIADSSNEGTMSEHAPHASAVHERARAVANAHGTLR